MMLHCRDGCVYVTGLYSLEGEAYRCEECEEEGGTAWNLKYFSGLKVMDELSFEVIK